jgi:hypothetical protein
MARFHLNALKFRIFFADQKLTNRRWRPLMPKFPGNDVLTHKVIHSWCGQKNFSLFFMALRTIPAFTGEQKYRRIRSRAWSVRAR